MYIITHIDGELRSLGVDGHLLVVQPVLHRNDGLRRVRLEQERLHL